MRTVNKHEIALYRHAPKFVPAGQSTQMIIGATGESDYQIMKVAQHMYDRYEMKRVFYSAFIRVNEDSLLPALPGDRHFCGNTGFTRQTGCCAIMDSVQRICCRKTSRILMYL